MSKGFNVSLSNNFIGVGMSNPVARLDVYDNANWNHTIISGGNSDTVPFLATLQDGAGTSFKNWNDSLYGFGFFYDTTGLFKLNRKDNQTGVGTNVLTITRGGGNVGIGTTDPQAKLHVNGSMYLGIGNSSSSSRQTMQVYAPTDNLYQVSTGTTLWGKSVQIKAADLSGALWNSGGNGIGNVAGAAGDVYITAGNLDNGANNGTAPCTMYGGNVVLQAGTATWNSSSTGGITPGSIIFHTGNPNSGNDTVLYERMRIGGNGVGINTTVLNGYLNIYSPPSKDFVMFAAEAGEWWNYNMTIKTRSVDGGGYPLYDFIFARRQFSGINGDQLTLRGGGVIRFNAYTAGTLSTDSSGNITTSSDKRVKQNIQYITESSSLEKVNALKPASYELLSDIGRTRLGFIAQDVENVIPDAVDGKKYEYWYKRKEDGSPDLDENGHIQFEENPQIRPRSLDTTAILAHAVKAVQELTSIVHAQGNMIKELKDKLGLNT